MSCNIKIVDNAFHVIKELSREEEDDQTTIENVEVQEEGTLNNNQFQSGGSVKQLKHQKERNRHILRGDS
jgi:hypothetical protein